MRLAPLSLLALLAPLLVTAQLERHAKRRLPHEVERNGAGIVRRQGPGPTETTVGGGGGPTSTADAPTTTSSPTPSPTSTSSSSSSSPTPTSTTTSSSSSSSSSPATSSTPSSTRPSSSSSFSSSLSLSTSSISSTTSIPVVTYTSSGTHSEVASSSTTSESPTAPPSGGGGGGISSGTIIGLSVAAGIGLLGIIGFIIWKLKKKRFADFDDDDGNAIRWPELDGASAMHPLPARPTGRSGIETSALDRSEDAFDGRSMGDSSTADLAVHAAQGPYSMPAADPHQQYYDDPSHVSGAYGAPPAGGAYYDPYRGPVPPTLSPHPEEDPYGGTTADTQHAGGYDMYATAAGGGRAPSPGPNAAYGGRTSPGPQAAYGGRSGSPGPEIAYAADRSTSPGPQAAYGLPRVTSPGPQAAYGGPRTTSPGPDGAYGSYR